MWCWVTVISVNKTDVTTSAIGVMGGMFNPIHNGHLRAAVELSEALALSSVAMMPCHQPAHKVQPQQSSEQRQAMLNLALKQYPQLVLDKREMLRGDKTPSYTVDSLQQIRSDAGENVAIYFAMGSDAFSAIESWYQWQELFTFANIVVLHRPGSVIDCSKPFLANRLTAVNQRGKVAGNLYELEVPALDISSTRIRALIAQQKNISGLLPEAVENYIYQHKLYQ